MTLQSASYFLFLLVMGIAAWTFPSARLKQKALLLASLVFSLSWGLVSMLLLFVSAAFNLAWGRLLKRRPTAFVLWMGLAVNIAWLCLFKYAASLLAWISGSSGDGAAALLVSVGVSFYTFQAMSWLMDIYRGREEDPTAIEFLLYMSFWPTLLSGPVCRIGGMLPQYRSDERATADDIAEGARRIVAGLFLKVVLADTLARGLYAGEGVVFGFDRLSGGYSGVDALLLAVGFGFQLYFDFAGYSNIAIGSARVLGIRVRENFNDPYLAGTPTEFWTRWHMSLSSWIRDYLFFPLASLRPGLAWRNGALVLAMTLFGIWHGAGATFALWGFYQGILLVGHRQLQALSGRMAGFRLPAPAMSVLAWSATFTLVTLGWIPFRSRDLGQTAAMLSGLLRPEGWLHRAMRPDFYIVTPLVVLGYFGFAGIRRLAAGWGERTALSRLAWLASPVYYAAALFLVIVWSLQGSTFLYFQF